MYDDIDINRDGTLCNLTVEQGVTSVVRCKVLLLVLQRSGHHEETTSCSLFGFDVQCNSIEQSLS
jgi:hypothetical protein